MADCNKYEEIDEDSSDEEEEHAHSIAKLRAPSLPSCKTLPP